MKNIYYKILPVCLVAMGLAGCEDDTKYSQLAEAVPLAMEISGKTFVMGEQLTVDITVNRDADGNKVLPNEEFDVYFTAKTGNEDASSVFKDFHRVVTFPKGESNIQVDFPIKESGLSGSKNLEFVAFVRGYKVANSTQSLKVSDYYRVGMMLKNNAEGVVMEGDKFTLVASLDKPRAVPIEITVTPKEGEERYFENLPAMLTIPAGSVSITSGEVMVAQDGEITGDKDLTLNLISGSATNPMVSPTLVIHMQDIESLADPDLYDPTKVYANPEQLFISATDPWFGDKSVATMKEKDEHSNAALAAEKWKFYYATEFHQIKRCYVQDLATNHYIPAGFADATDIGTESAFVKVDNKPCSNVNAAGNLVIWGGVNTTAGPAPYSACAFHTAKVGGNLFALNYLRVYPGIRIEARVRIAGPRTGFVPIIELKDHVAQSVAKIKTISLLRNTKGSTIVQSVTGTTVSEIVSKNSSIPKVSDWNIYWVELVDDNTIKLGINGLTTLTVKKGDIPTWPFEKSAMVMDPKWGCKGLFLLFKIAPSPEMIAKTLPEGWDTDLRAIAPSEYETKGPRMEIDWVRYYTNDNYKVEANETNNRNSGLFY